MTKKTLSIYILIPLALAAIVGLVFLASSGSVMKEFQSAQYKLAFQYPAKYNLTEHVINTTQRYHVEEVLIDADWKQPENGEGPAALTFGVYQNNLDKQTAEQWIKGNNISNFKLSDGNLIPVELDGGKGFMYHWDGLYPAEQIVVAKGDQIYYIVVTYLDFNDDILNDFKKILPTVDLD